MINFQVVCCVCGKWRIDGVWVTTNIVALPEVVLSHGYCSSCAEKALEEIKRERELAKANK